MTATSTDRLPRYSRTSRNDQWLRPYASQANGHSITRKGRSHAGLPATKVAQGPGGSCLMRRNMVGRNVVSQTIRVGGGCEVTGRKISRRRLAGHGEPL